MRITHIPTHLFASSFVVAYDGLETLKGYIQVKII